MGYNNGIRIEIDEELCESEEEKIKSLIHEILHCGRSYNDLSMRKLPLEEYPRIEREIENLTNQVYSCQPVLRKWLSEKIAKCLKAKS